MITLNNIKFLNPWAFSLLILLPVIYFLFKYFERRKNPAVFFSSVKLLKGADKSLFIKLRNLPLLVRLLALACFIVALARPITYHYSENIYSEGIDIVLVLDISGSMLAKDFEPDRLEAAKKVISNFVDERESDRIGLVVFNRDAFTQCPLTLDYNILKNTLSEVNSDMLQSDGTAIGNALAMGINRLKNSNAKSKIIILLTDGVNNAGEVDPQTSAEIAKTFGVKVYTIGVGTNGRAPYPVQTFGGIVYQMEEVMIDEQLLTNIAEKTGGKYFRATDNNKLENIYSEIDKLEKSKIQNFHFAHHKELFYEWVFTGIVLLMFELLLSNTVFRKIP